MDPPPSPADVAAEILTTLGAVYELRSVLTRLCEHACRLLGADGAAVCLLDEEGRPAPVAASDEVIERLETLQQRLDQGPCIDVVTGGAPIVADEVAALEASWPGFVDALQRVGFRAVASLPVRLGTSTVGVVDLFARTPPALTEGQDDVVGLITAAVGAYVANHEHRAHAEATVSQLQHALRSRVTIEQAKGMLSARLAIGPADAFELLRSHARDRNLKVADVAARIVAGQFWLEHRGP